MKNIMWFSELGKNNIPEVGGKGANLGEMMNAGIPIPDGFVLSSEAYFKFIKANNLEPMIREQLTNLDCEDTTKLMKASTFVKNGVLSGRIPEDLRDDIINSYRALSIKTGLTDIYVAVRSSATAEDLPEASFAGQQSTFLNISGEGDLLQAVKECWASLFEGRSIYYRVENKFEHMKVALAVVVQEMVDSEKAGVMFTVDPITQDRNTIVIEGIYGLGEMIVSGSIMPDRFLINKKSMKIEKKEINEQSLRLARVQGQNREVTIDPAKARAPKVTDDEVNEIAKLGVEIENHYGTPQDIEWAINREKVFIVQSRPITTLKKESQQPAVSGSGLRVSGTDGAGKTVPGTRDSKPETTKQIQTASVPAPAAPLPAVLGSGSRVQSSETRNSNPETSIGQAKVLMKGLGASPGIGTGPVKIVRSPEEIANVQKGDVLVAEMTTPDYVMGMKRAVAILTDSGGSTCHAAIVSRELGVPCIVGTREATKLLKDGQVITVDAKRGIVYDGAIQLEAPAAVQATGGSTGGVGIVIGETKIVTGTKIYVNLGEVDLVEKVSKYDADGVGLLRAEFMIAGIGEHPRKIINEGRQQEYIDKLAENLRTFASGFYPRPVVYRAADFKTNEYRNLKGGAEYEPNEANPMMGYRGCSRYISEPDIFKLELAAIKKVRDEFGLKNLWLMIPFVRRIGELRAIKDIMKEVGMYHTRDFKLWIMVEVPSTVILIDKFCEEGIDGVSIGSNDLTQLTLGIDRDNETMAEGFDERNEAVLRSIRQVVTICKKYGVTVSICGQAPSVYPDFTEMLVEFGMTSISVNPDAVEKTRRIVASAEKKVMLRRLEKLDKLNFEGNGKGSGKVDVSDYQF
ncbi:phosphoenolpyruvate synthase [Candidatus Micrarchaeota archaeon CG08_land_8_20_14_0_20_49_17]|nr:MAG: phosphoenolpyruvate synthase [Candidatus Micrarchaeota archaeon CG08_land_8_20_14_0_20_49_17]HII53371.1 phosphoenolpyruvate synthase [Candidatus Micrarchaeota archaeon]